MEQLELTLTLSKTTKGTHVYANEDKGITGIYLPKLLFGAAAANPPAKIKITINPAG